MSELYPKDFGKMAIEGAYNIADSAFILERIYHIWKTHQY